MTKKAHPPEKNSIVSKVGLVPVPMPKHIWRNSALEKDSVGLKYSLELDFNKLFQYATLMQFSLP